MLRAAFALARVVLLVRCIFSAEAREEFRNYIQEAAWWMLALDGVAALIGFALVGMMLVGLHRTALDFYNIATTGRVRP